LLGFLKEELEAEDSPVGCPRADCSASISLFDVQLILGEHLFERTADCKIRRYVEASDNLKMCPKCSLLLDVQQDDTEIRCDTCGYFKCLKCGTNHKSIN
jgi:DNA-directed RNA polymerase subunit RPC12/RpoP